MKLKHGEVVEYYQQGVVLYLLSSLIPVPVDVEMLRPGEGEAQAAMRLIERVLAAYPRLFDGVVADSLYATAPFVRFCRARKKHVIVVLKDERRDLFQDAQGVFELVRSESFQDGPRRGDCWDEEGFTSMNLQEPVRVVHSHERLTRRARQGGRWVEQTAEQDWWWVTTLAKAAFTTDQVRRVGHARWDIENKVFGDLSMHWGLDHCYRHDPTAITAFVLTLFVAFIMLKCFFERNLKAPVRKGLTLIALALELIIGLAGETFTPPWLAARRAG